MASLFDLLRDAGRRCWSRWRDAALRITKSRIFSGFIVHSICLDTFLLALQTDRYMVRALGRDVFIGANYAFFVVYTLEFLIRLSVNPTSYWKCKYHLYDFLVLILSHTHCFLECTYKSTEDASQLGVLRTFRALQTLKLLRIISFMRGLQVLITALLDTIIKWVLAIILLLCIIMFLFANMGYFYFGYSEKGDTENWGSLARATLTLFDYVTLDGWTELVGRLEDAGYLLGGRLFTIIFILVGHFIFSNAIVAVIIMNVSEAAEMYKIEQKKKKEEIINRKKQLIMKKQHEEVMQLIQKQKHGNFSNFAEMVEDYQERLHHDECVMTSDLCTNMFWIETLLRTLDHMDNTMYNLRQLHFEMANLLAEVTEERLEQDDGI